jgi:hypothetical protein
MIKVRRKIQFATRERGRQVLTDAPASVPQLQGGRILRVSRLMALAIHFDRLIREGTVKDVTELARLTHVTQPRMTQLLNLTHLAPDIQEELLFLPPAESGRDRVHEKMLRGVAAESDWRQQRQLWRRSTTGHRHP